MSAFTLKNGLRVHLVPVSGTEAATVLVLCKVGSRYENPEISGASHFIEHLMFKGTKRRPTTLDISRELDAVGAEYNAYTGKDVTGYYVTADAAHLKNAIDILHDMLFHSVFDKKEMDRERGVIIEEINMYQDNPLMHVEDLLESAMFEGSTLGWEIAGTPETMRSMSREAVLAYRDAHYVPARMVVCAAGKLDRLTRRWLEDTFGRVPNHARQPNGYEPFVPGRAPAPRRVHTQRKATEQVQIALGFPSYGHGDKRNPAAALLSSILGGTMSSRLFISVRERKGLAYLVRSSNAPYEDVGVFAVQAGLDKSRLPLAVKTIRDELRKMKKQGVTARELREAKDHVRGRLLLKLEGSAERAEWVARQELYLGQVKSLDERMRAFARVTPKQVQAVANDLLDERKMSVAGIGPFASGKDFLQAAGLGAWL